MTLLDKQFLIILIIPSLALPLASPRLRAWAVLLLGLTALILADVALARFVGFI